MKLGKKIVVTIGVLLSALLCVNMILYTPASADGNTKLKTSKNDISSETVNMHQGVSMSYAQIVQTYSDEYSVSLYSDKWKKFKSHAEMVKNCQLEDEKIQRMSTNELFNVVMAYPLLIDVFLYDDIDQGIKSVSQQYNGLRELLKRDDLQDVLYHKYLTYSKIEDVIIAVDNMFPDYPKVTVCEGFDKLLYNGNKLPEKAIIGEIGDNKEVRLYNNSQEFIGIYKYEKGEFIPVKIFYES